jgi:hypothetical protein
MPLYTRIFPFDAMNTTSELVRNFIAQKFLFPMTKKQGMNSPAFYLNVTLFLTSTNYFIRVPLSGGSGWGDSLSISLLGLSGGSGWGPRLRDPGAGLSGGSGWGLKALTLMDLLVVGDTNAFPADLELDFKASP